MSKVKDGGITTAYGAAVRGGYAGTYTQFCADLAQLADVLSEFLNFSVTVETLAEGEPATARYEDGVLSLGIPKGDTGNGISRIEKTGTAGLVDTYTVTYTDGQTFSYTVTNGAKGDQGDDYVLTTADKEEIADLVEELVEVTVTGTIAEIATLKNHRYICGELASLDVTSLPTSGLVDILFTSGSTATVVTLPAAVQMPAWFEVGANMTVEISILDGVWGSVQVWES